MDNIPFTAAQAEALETTRQQFSEWRAVKTGKAKIPDALWQAAARLFTDYGLNLNQITRSLRLNHTVLRQRIHPQPIGRLQTIPDPTPAFIEIAPIASQAECIIEMENQSGIKMRMSFRGKADPELVELGRFIIKEVA